MISEEANNLISKVIDEYQDGDWDFLKLQSRRKTKNIKIRKIDNKYSFAICFTRSTGATAYIVNRFGAKQMVDKLLPIETPYDHAFDRPFFLKIRVRAIYPYPVELIQEHAEISTIETSKPLKKKGFSLVESISEADMQLKLEAYCSDGTAGLGCHRVYGFITVSSLESNESVYLKKITDSSIFGNANKQAAVDSDIVKIPKCSDIVL